MMANQTVSPNVTTPHLVEALLAVMAVNPDNRETAQAEIVDELEDPLAAWRRESSPQRRRARCC